MRSSIFWGVTQRMLGVNDVSGQPIGPILRVKESKKNSLASITDLHRKILHEGSKLISIRNNLKCLSQTF